jgi:hypothetical protein
MRGQYASYGLSGTAVAAEMGSASTAWVALRYCSATVVSEMRA